MNLLDIFILICIIMGGRDGYKSGLIEIVTELAGFIGGAFLAIIYAPSVAEYLFTKFAINLTVGSFVVFFLIWGAVILVMTTIGKVATKILGLPIIGTVNQIAGFVLGAAKGLLISIPFLVLISYFHPELMNNSACARPFQKILVQISHHFFNEYDTGLSE
jgi:membrane protein required for colicin V production